MPDLALDLRYLRYALTALEYRSFRRAAVVLGFQQSTVSRRIRLLEHRLGFPLFIRDHRGVRPTLAGERFLHEAAVGVKHLDRAARLAVSAHQGESGELRVGILASLTTGFLRSVLRRFREAYPDVRVRIHESTSEASLRRLALGELDVSFVIGRPELSGHASAALWIERVHVMLPKGHELSRHEAIRWADVRREPFIVSEGGPGPETQDYLVKRLYVPGFRPSIEVHQVGSESLMNLVAMGYGLTLTGSSSIRPDAAGVVFRPVAGEKELVSLSAVWSPSNSNPALRLFLSLAETVSAAKPVN